MLTISMHKIQIILHCACQCRSPPERYHWHISTQNLVLKQDSQFSLFSFQVFRLSKSRTTLDKSHSNPFRQLCLCIKAKCSYFYEKIYASVCLAKLLLNKFKVVFCSNVLSMFCLNFLSFIATKKPIISRAPWPCGLTCHALAREVKGSSFATCCFFCQFKKEKERMREKKNEERMKDDDRDEQKSGPVLVILLHHQKKRQGHQTETR